MARTSYLKRVIRIKRIQNKELYRNYMSNKDVVTLANPDISNVEQTLWHGTNTDVVDRINHAGLYQAPSVPDKDMTLLGKGVYFTTEAREAHHYTFRKNRQPPKDGIHVMYVCKVLTGSYTLGSPKLVETPFKDDMMKQKYDSVVEAVENPHIFVVFENARAYPEYLIEYESKVRRITVEDEK